MLFVSAARVRIVHEPAVRRPAADDYLLIAGLQRLLLDLSYPRVAEGRAIIRRPLEDGELRGRLGGLLDHLDAGRAGSDDRHAFALERSEEHTSELQSLMRISYAVFCLKNKNTHHNERKNIIQNRIT